MSESLVKVDDPTELSRVQWMNTEGTPLYDEWAEAVLEECSSEEFLGWLVRDYRHALGIGEPLRDNHESYESGLGNGDFIFNMLSERMEGAMREHPATDMLVGRYEEIMKYTSAASSFFTTYGHNDYKANYTSKEIHPRITHAIAQVVMQVKAIDHGIDAMKFGMGAAYYIARDFAMQEEGNPWAWEVLEDPLYDEHWPESTERILAVADILEDPQFAQCLEGMGATAFGVLSNTFALDHGRGNNSQKYDPAGARAKRVGMQELYERREAFSILYRDDEGIIRIRPQVQTFLHAKLREQNQKGLLTDDENSAGRLLELDRGKGKIGSRCPVAVEHGDHPIGELSYSGIAQTARYLGNALRYIQASTEWSEEVGTANREHYADKPQYYNLTVQRKPKKLG